MKPSMIRIAFFLCFCFLLLNTEKLQAQQLEQVVHLKNGTIIKGELLEYEQGGQLKIKIAGGSILVYNSDDVELVETKQVTLKPTDYKPSLPKKKPLNTDHKGFYGNIAFGFSATAAEYPNFGFIFHATLGAQLSEHFVVAGGTGIITSINPSMYCAPTYISLRSYLNKDSGALFVETHIGAAFQAGFPLIFWNRYKVGWYARPAIGIRIPSTKRAHVSLDAGVDIIDSFDRWVFLPAIRLGITF